MSQVIDEKVVEMKFDNSNFESNVKESLSTLDKLKKSLDLSESAKTFDSVSKAASKVSFDGLSEGIETIKVKFSTLEYVAANALSNIVNRAVDAGMAMAKSLSIDLVSEGMGQYEQKSKAVQTIMNATGLSIDEVNSQLEKLIWFTDETSYSFGDMTNNIGKFTSMGVSLDASVDAMMGISNWAAVSGQGINEASRAMYNLSQAMGLGYVGKNDWMSIQGANMATKEFKEQVIATAEALGTIKKGEVDINNFDNNLTKGKWFTSDVLLKVLQQYSEYTNLVYEQVDAAGGSASKAMELVDQLGTSYSEVSKKAFQAAQEARTFSDAVSAVKDAVKSQWATLFESVFGNYEEAKVLWTDLSNTLYDIFADPLAVINDTVKEALSGETITQSQWIKTSSELRKSLNLTEDEFESFEKVVTDVARKNGIAIDDIIEEYRGFGSSLSAGWLTTDILNEALSDIEEGSVSTGNALEDVQDIVKRVWNGEFGRIDTGRYEKLKELGWDPDEIQKLVDKGSDYVLTIDDISDSMLKNLGYSEEQIEVLRKIAEAADQAGTSLNELASHRSGRDLLREGMGNVVEALGTYAQAAREAFSEVFGTLESGDIYNIIERFHNFTENLLSEDRIEGFKSAIHNIATVLHVIFNTVKGIFGIAKAIFSGTIGPIIKGLGSILGSLANGIFGLFDKLDGSEGYLNAFGTAAEWVSKKLEPFAKVVNLVSTGISGLIDGLFDGKGIGNAFKTGMNRVIESLDPVKDKKLINGLRNFTKNFFDFTGKLKNLGSNIGRTFKNIGSKIAEAFDIFKGTDLGQRIQNAFQKVKDFFSNAWDNLKNWFKTHFSSDGEEGGGFDFFGSVSNIFTKFNDWLDNLNLQEKLDGISDSITKVVDKIKNFFSRNKEGIDELEGNSEPETVFDKAKNGYDNLAEKIKSNSTIQKALTTVKNKVTSIRDSIEFPEMKKFEGKFSLETVLENIKNIISWIVDHAPSWDTVLKTIMTVLGGTSLVSLIGVFKQLKNLFSGPTGLANNLNGILKGVKLALKGFAFNQFSEGILKLAGAIGIIALALIGLSFIDTEKLITVGLVLVGIAAALGLVAVGISKLIGASKEAGGSGGTNTIKDAIAGTITSIGDSVKTFLTVSAYSSAILKVAIAIGILAFAISKLANINVIDLAKAVAVITVMFLEISLFMKALQSNVSGLTTRSGGTLDLGLLLGGIASALMSLSSVVKTVAGIDIFGLIKSLSAIGVLLFMMSKFLGSIKADNGLGFGTALAFVGLAISLKLIASALKGLAKLDMASLAVATMSLISILGALTLFFKFSDVGNMKSSSAIGLIAMGAALLLFANAVKEMGQLELGNIVQGLIGLAGAMGVMALGVKLMSGAGSGLRNISFLLLGISAVVVAIAAAIWLVTKALEGADLETLQQNLTTLFVGLVGALVDTLVGSTDKIFGGIVSLLDGLVTYVPQIIDKVIDVFLLVLDGLANSATELAGGIANFVKAFMTAFGIAFEGVDILPLIEGIGALLASTYAIIGIGKFGSFTNVLSGLGKVGLVLAAFAAVITALAGINELVKALGGNDDSMMNFLKTGGELLSTIGTALGNFVGSIVGGIVGGVAESAMIGIAAATSYLPQIGSDLSGFMTNAEDFISGAGDIPDGLGDKIAGLAGGMLALTGAEFVDSIANGLKRFLGLDEEGNKYIDNFTELAEGLVAFSTTLKDGEFDDEAITSATNAGELIKTLIDALPGEGGLPALFSGDKSANLSKAGDIFSNLGLGVAGFLNSITDAPLMGGASTLNAKRAAEVLETLMNIIPPTGGLKATLFGDQSEGLNNASSIFGGIGNGVAAFMSAIASISGLNASKISNAEKAGGVLKILIESLPKEGGVFGFLNGSIPWESLEERFGYLGAGVAAFLTATSESTYNDSVDSAVKALSSLMELVPSEGGVFDLLTGTKDFSKAKDNFTNLGTGVSAFMLLTSVATYNDSVEGAIKAIGLVMDIVPNEGGIWQDIAGSKDFSKVPQNFANLGAGIAAFCLAIENASLDDTTSVENATSALKSIMGVIPATDGVWQAFWGESNYDKAETNFKSLGAGVAAFCTSIANMTYDETAISNAQEALPIITDIITNIPTTGGVWQDIWGEKDLSTAGTNISYLGNGIANFIGSMKEFSSSEVGNAKTAAQDMIEIINLDWPTKGGFFNWVRGVFEGDTDWDDLKEKLPDIAGVIKTFSESISGTQDVSNAKEAADALASIIDANWPTTGGLFDWAKGDVAWDQVLEMVPTIGEVIQKFSNSLTGINTSDMSNASAAMSLLNELLGTAATIDFEQPNNNFYQLVNYLDQLREHVSDFINDLSESFDNDNAATVLESVSGLMTSIASAMNPEGDGSFQSIGLEDITAFGTGLSDGSDTVLTTVKTILSSVILGLADIYKFKNVATINMYAFALGLSGSSSYLLNIANNVSNSIARAFQNNNAFYEAGVYMIRGIENGISSELPKLIALSEHVAAAAVNALNSKQGFDEHSPSRKGFQSGRFVMLGIAQGIIDNSYAAEDAAANSAQKTIDVMSSVLSHINTDELDAAPTIRPVLDLSEIQNGAGLIGGILNTESSVGFGIAATRRLASSIGTAGFESLNAGYNDTQVLRTIDKLGSKVDDLSKSIQGMQVTINGKRLVGAIAGDMEAELNSRIVKQRRGVM